MRAATRDLFTILPRDRDAAPVHALGSALNIIRSSGFKNQSFLNYVRTRLLFATKLHYNAAGIFVSKHLRYVDQACITAPAAAASRMGHQHDAGNITNITPGEVTVP